MKFSMENDKILFERLVRYLTIEEGIEIKVEDNDSNIYSFPNAVAGQDEYIVVYKKPTDDSWGMLTSLLIHEFGHICCWGLDLDNHSEYDAWLMGIDNIPIKFWPKTLKSDYRICLKSYGISDQIISKLDNIVDDYYLKSSK